MQEFRRLSDNEASKLRKLKTWEFEYIRSVGFTLSEPDQDNFQIVTYYGESLHDIIDSTQSPEWIYILANKICPGVLKIGYTTKSVFQRVKEINSATGVVSPWFDVYTYKCANGYQLEKEIHANLQAIGTRINPAREGFEIQVDTAIKLIEKLGSNYKF